MQGDSYQLHIPTCQFFCYNVATEIDSVIFQRK